MFYFIAHKNAGYRPTKQMMAKPSTCRNVRFLLQHHQEEPKRRGKKRWKVGFSRKQSDKRLLLIFKRRLLICASPQSSIYYCGRCEERGWFWQVSDLIIIIRNLFHLFCFSNTCLANLISKYLYVMQKIANKKVILWL